MKRSLWPIILTLIVCCGLLSDQNPTIASVVSAFSAPDLTGLLNSPERMGLASWYSRRSPGIRKHTANNEVFDDTAMTCAIWGVPFNRMVKVTNLSNGKSVILRVNDRGPHARYAKQGRVIDLTKAAFDKLDHTKKGLLRVRVEFL